jgi:hypothetical protein
MKFAWVGLFFVACGAVGSTEDAPGFGVARQAEETYPTLPRWHALTIVAQEEMREIGSTGEWELLTTYIHGLVETRSQGEKPQLAFQPCRIILPEVVGITPELPDATVQLVAPVIVEGVWTKEGDLYRLKTPAWSAIVFGAELASPLSDALPTDKDDDRVVDLDDDRKPGVTMKASIGRLYMALRGMMRLDGTFDPKTPAAGLSGTAEYKRDFVIYGDNVFGVAKRQVEKAYENSETRPAETTGTVKPLSIDAPTCADVI